MGYGRLGGIWKVKTQGKEIFDFRFSIFDWALPRRFCIWNRVVERNRKAGGGDLGFWIFDFGFSIGRFRAVFAFGIVRWGVIEKLAGNFGFSILDSRFSIGRCRAVFAFATAR
jgi:hypothetical protein